MIYIKNNAEIKQIESAICNNQLKGYVNIKNSYLRKLR